MVVYWSCDFWNEEVRQLLLHRCRLVQLRTRVKNQLDAMHSDFILRCASCLFPTPGACECAASEFRGPSRGVEPVPRRQRREPCRFDRRNDRPWPRKAVRLDPCVSLEALRVRRTRLPMEGGAGSSASL